jgi:hypothetical protein
MRQVFLKFSEPPPILCKNIEIPCGKYFKYADSFRVSAYFCNHYYSQVKYNKLHMTKVDRLAAVVFLIPSSVVLVNDKKSVA